MKNFIEHSLLIHECIKELDEFKKLLYSKKSLKENAEILPFFKQNLHLGAFIGTYIPDIANPDRIANEYDLFGDFACDLVVGDSKSKTFLLIEFEDASPGSLFVVNGKKTTPDWAPRLEHGFSQVLDWFWKLSDMEKSDDYENRFGTRHATIHGLVVVGREDDNLAKREKDRLLWRQEHLIVHSKKVSVITFDQLVRDLEYRLSRYSEVAKVDES